MDNGKAHMFDEKNPLHVLAELMGYPLYDADTLRQTQTALHHLLEEETDDALQDSNP
jgi:hypothetical protein